MQTFICTNMQLSSYHVNNKDFINKLCSLVYKIYKLKKQIVIAFDSNDLKVEVDKKLWTFRQDAFLPHIIADEGINKDNEIDLQPILLVDNFSDDQYYEKYYQHRSVLIYAFQGIEFVNMQKQLSQVISLCRIKNKDINKKEESSNVLDFEKILFLCGGDFTEKPMLEIEKIAQIIKDLEIDKANFSQNFFNGTDWIVT